MWPRQLPLPEADSSPLCANTCAVWPYRNDSTSGSRPGPENSVLQDNHPPVHLSGAVRTQCSTPEVLRAARSVPFALGFAATWCLFPEIPDHPARLIAPQLWV